MRRLLIRPGAIGDVIVSLPALEHLRAEFTEVWTTEVVVPLIRFADRVDTIIGSGLDALELPVGTRARMASFDSIVSWYGEGRAEFREALRGLPVEFLQAIPGTESGVHAVDWYMDQVGGMRGANPKLAVKRQDQGFVAIHPFASSAKKTWPLERFQAVARELGRPVRWVAGPQERLEGAERFDSLWELAEWLGGASLYLGNDSGIGHLAAACGVPVVALFGPTEAQVWAPRGPRVEVVISPDGTMAGIDVEAASAASRRHLR